jgi:hypothetical protein
VDVWGAEELTFGQENMFKPPVDRKKAVLPLAVEAERFLKTGFSDVWD